jgi:hypothetical protein
LQVEVVAVVQKSVLAQNPLKTIRFLKYLDRKKIFLAIFKIVKIIFFENLHFNKQQPYIT